LSVVARSASSISRLLDRLLYIMVVAAVVVVVVATTEAVEVAVAVEVRAMVVRSRLPKARTVDPVFILCVENS
jgi:hypothetical protein